VPSKVPPHLAQEWVHSHEEDSGGTRVYRPPSFAFPLSRGRESFQLKAGGSLIESGPGPDDRRQTASGKWSVAGTRLTLKKAGSPDRVYQIVSVASDKLVLKEEN
jgi:hypothetical protein